MMDVHFRSERVLFHFSSSRYVPSVKGFIFPNSRQFSHKARVCVCTGMCHAQSPMALLSKTLETSRKWTLVINRFNISRHAILLQVRKPCIRSYA